MLPPRLLTPGWNNLLALVLGLPALAFVIHAFTSGLWTEPWGLVGLGVVGFFY